MRIAWMAAVVAATIGAGCAPEAAAAAVRSGSVTDPAEGGATPGRDLVRAAGTFDTTSGALAATLRFAGPVSAQEGAQFRVDFAFGVTMLGFIGDGAAEVYSSVFKQPPGGFPPVSNPQPASFSVSPDGRDVTVSYTDARMAALDLDGLRVEVYSATDPVPIRSGAEGTVYDSTDDPLWFEGFAPRAITRPTPFKDITTAKGSATEIVDVAQANSVVTARLVYAGKTVGTQTVAAVDAGKLPVTVALTSRGRKLLQSSGKGSTHKARVTLLTIVSSAAGAPPPGSQRRTISLPF
jgi:hypothetical protein